MLAKPLAVGAALTADDRGRLDELRAGLDRQDPESALTGVGAGLPLAESLGDESARPGSSSTSEGAAVDILAT